MVDRPLVSLVLIVLPIIVLICMELLAKRCGVSPEITRKISHIVLGGIAVIGFIEGPLWLYAASIIVLAGGILLSLRRTMLRSLHGVERATFGELFLPLGLLAPLPLTLTAPDIYIVSILIVTFADSAAGLVGYFRKSKSKSLMGSLAFFVVASVILMLSGLTAPLVAVGIAAVVTLVERYSSYGSDNVTIPLAATVLLTLF